jgi:hypothetical protein
MNHVLVIANETVAGQTLIEALKSRAAAEETRVTVVAPINEPREGYVVYEDTRRAAAGRRLDRTLQLLREAGVPASGLVVDTDPVNATRDAIAQAEPPIDSVIVSTHPPERSGWMQRNVPERVRKAADPVPVEHVVVDVQAEGGPANVLVVANETVVGERLLEWIRERARRSPASFLIVAPQSDPSVSAHPQAERRLRRALTILRGEGLDAHGQVAHPDPYSAAMHAVRDERVDEILVSTFPEARGSSWLRRDLVGRLRKDAGVPVEHIEIAQEEVGVAS